VAINLFERSNATSLTGRVASLKGEIFEGRTKTYQKRGPPRAPGGERGGMGVNDFPGVRR